nr:hypothetical protein [Tanacetum cinerariifolium]
NQESKWRARRILKPNLRVLFMASGDSDRDAEDALSKLLQMELLRARSTSLEEAFSLACITKARFEAITEKKKEHIIKKKSYIIISLQSELASPEIKWSLDAGDEDIGIDEVSSAIDCVFHIALEIYCEKSRGAAENGRRVLCYVKDSRRLKKKKMEAQRRLWDLEIKSAF